MENHIDQKLSETHFWVHKLNVVRAICMKSAGEWHCTVCTIINCWVKDMGIQFQLSTPIQFQTSKYYLDWFLWALYLVLIYFKLVDRDREKERVCKSNWDYSFTLNLLNNNQINWQNANPLSFSLLSNGKNNQLWVFLIDQNTFYSSMDIYEYFFIEFEL